MSVAEAGRPTSRLETALYACAFLASVGGLFSIALSHASLGVALVLLLVARRRLSWPPVLLPLGVFMCWTLISMVASGEPSVGLPQVKKFYVFALLAVVYTVFRSVDRARRLAEAWFVVGGGVMLVAVVQFVLKWNEAAAAGESFVVFYAPDRITGLFSHWMTFSQTGLLIGVMLVSYVLFGESSRRGRPVWILLAMLSGFGLVLSGTRSVWLAMGLVGIYLVWAKDRRLLWAAPLALAFAAVTAPEPIRERLAWTSKEARPIMWRTGWNMIRDRPLTGVGPMRVGRLFGDYLPPDVDELPDAYYEHLHNVYIHYAAERGVPAALAIVALLLKLLWDFAGALRRGPPGRSDERFLVHGALAATLAVAIVGCFDLTLGDSEILGAFLGIVAVGYRGVEGLRPRNYESRA